MPREIRPEPRPGFQQTIVGWLLPDGAVANDTDDRFNTFLAVEDWDTDSGYGHRGETITDKGIHHLTLEELLTLGFTTREYQAMMHFWSASHGFDQVKSERELTALISSTFVGHLDDSRHHDFVREARYGRFPERAPAMEPSGRVRRRELVEQEISWIEPGVRDRKFHAADRFYGSIPTDAAPRAPLAETGIMDWTLLEVSDWGFIKEEYLAMMFFEIASDGKDHIRSEEELNITIRSGGGIVQHLDAAERVIYSRIDSLGAGPRDVRFLSPRTIDEDGPGRPLYFP